MGDYVESIKSRAIALGIQNDYVDEHHFFGVYNNKFCFILDNFVDYMLKNCPKISVYEIPEGVWGVIFSSDATVFNTNNKKIKIVTNQDLMFFGTVDSKIKFEPNKIVLDLRYTDVFKTVTIDFTKSKRLNSIDAHSFVNCEIDSLYFGNGLTTVYHNAFMNCKINNLIFKNLQRVDCRAFYLCYVYNQLELGKELQRVETDGLSFASICNEVILRGNDIYNSSFSNVKNIYLCPYIEEDNDEFINFLIDMADKLKSGKIMTVNAFQTISEYIKYYEEPIYSNDLMYNIGKAYQEEKIDLLVNSLKGLLSNSHKMKMNFYLYSNNYLIDTYDVHDRDYRLVYTDYMINLYVEH